MGTTQDVTLYDEDGNEISSSNPLPVTTQSSGSDYPQYSIIRDPDTPANQASVDSSGQLKVVTPPPTPPAGTTKVVQTAQGNQGSHATAYLDYTIPNGETLVIQRFAGGAEGSAESKISLYYDSTGTGTGELIAVGYVGNTNFQFDLDEEYIGDGTARIRLQRTRLDAGTRETFGRWEGYY